MPLLLGWWRRRNAVAYSICREGAGNPPPRIFRAWQQGSLGPKFQDHQSAGANGVCDHKRDKRGSFAIVDLDALGIIVVAWLLEGALPFLVN